MPTIILAHSLELSAVIAGLLNIYLAGRASIWNWFFGIITVSLYFVIFKNVGLYADMSLQIVFLILQFYGLYQWLKKSDSFTAITVSSIPRFLMYTAATVTITLFIVISYLLQHYSNSNTVYFDALITSLSLVAQWMMSKKWIEHWLIWITVDIISIYVYITKNLYFTSALYAAFFLLCIQGYFLWRRSITSSLCSSQ